MAMLRFQQVEIPAIVLLRLGLAPFEFWRCAIDVDEMRQCAHCGVLDTLDTKAGMDPRIGSEKTSFILLKAPPLGRGDWNKPPVSPVIPITVLLGPIQVTHVKLYQGSPPNRRPALCRQA